LRDIYQMGRIMVTMLRLQAKVKAPKPKVQSETKGKEQGTTAKNHHYRQQGQSGAGTASQSIAKAVFAHFC
jgi:hypothetical protein